jgi:hypothetical protein
MMTSINFNIPVQNGSSLHQSGVDKNSDGTINMADIKSLVTTSDIKNARKAVEKDTFLSQDSKKSLYFALASAEIFLSVGKSMNMTLPQTMEYLEKLNPGVLDFSTNLSKL